MATQKQFWRIGAAQHGVRLEQFLVEALPKALGREIPRSLVRRLIAGGLVSRNGRRERLASYALSEGTRVEVFLDPRKLENDTAEAKTREPEFVWTPERILFEDKWLIVVDKPAGLPTQPTLDPGRPSVFGTLQGYLAKRDGGTPYLGLHHRLDRDTSGVLLFTKDQRVNAAAGALFAEKTARKTYLALAVGGLAEGDAPEWAVENYLGVVGRVGKASKFGAVRSGGDPAQTQFRLLERLHGAWLVEARPLTGRTHQIRVHLAEGGHPILGDELYGGPKRLPDRSGNALSVPRVMLHAAALEFPHPVTGAVTRIDCAVPADINRVAEALRGAVQ